MKSTVGSVKKGSSKAKASASGSPFKRLYAASDLRPLDIMVSWQVASGKSQPEAYWLAVTIAQRKFNPGKSAESSSSKSKESKEDARKERETKKWQSEWQAKFDSWKAGLPKRGWKWGDLKAKVSALKKAGKKYEEVKTLMKVKTRS